MSSASKNLQCENLTVTEGAQAGLVLTCVSAQGKVAWAAGGGGGGGDQQGFRAKDGATVITDNAAASVGGDVTGNLMGDDSCAGGPNSVSIGASSVAIGSGAQANADLAIAIGPSSTTDAIAGVSIGTGASATADSAVAIGNTSEAASQAVAVGPGATADADSVAVGYNASTLGMTGAVSIGKNITALEVNSFNATHRALALAASPTVTGNAAVFDGNELLATPLTMNTEGDISNVVTINGLAYPPSSSTANGYEITETVQGDIHTDSSGIAVALGQNSVSIGWATSNGWSIAVASDVANPATATDASIAVGNGAQSSDNSMAFGLDSQASGGSTAVGANSVATNGGLAIGGGTASANSIAIGDSTASNTSISIGVTSTAAGLYGIAIGINSAAAPDESVSIGNGVTAFEERSFNIIHRPIGPSPLETVSCAGFTGNELVTNPFVTTTSDGELTADYISTRSSNLVLLNPVGTPSADLEFLISATAGGWSGSTEFDKLDKASNVTVWQDTTSGRRTVYGTLSYNPLVDPLTVPTGTVAAGGTGLAVLQASLLCKGTALADFSTGQGKFYLDLPLVRSSSDLNGVPTVMNVYYTVNVSNDLIISFDNSLSVGPRDVYLPQSIPFHAVFTSY